ncbi:MAG: hypothetical protein WDN25_02050 [Acetobacteraceae bacterium]
MLLPRSTYWHLVHTLQATLPPPAADTAAALAHRDNAAIAEVASMLPANAEEVAIAARCVAAHAQAMDCLRLAHQKRDDIDRYLRCNAQCAGMLRQAGAARTLLLRVQAARRAREADPANCDQAAWIEHCAIGLMAHALNDAEPDPPPPPPPPAEIVAEPDASDRFSALTEAEQYAVTYPRRAAQIRALGGVPDRCAFGPPSAALVQAIVGGTSPILLELDRQPELANA